MVNYKKFCCASKPRKTTEGLELFQKYDLISSPTFDCAFSSLSLFLSVMFYNSVLMLYG